MRTVAIVALLGLVGTAPLQAQQLDPDRIGTQFDWGTVKVGLYPTQQFGMQLTFSTDVEAVFRLTHGMHGGFDPDSVLDWLNYADKVVHPTAPPPTPEAALLSPALRSWSGDSIRFLRRAKGRNWDPRLAVMVDEPGPHPDRFDILVLPEEAAGLLAGLQREAMLSGFNADTVKAMTSRPATPPVAEAGTPPTLLHAGPLAYPRAMRGVRGRVVMRYIIGPDGRPDPSSIVVLMADHVAFIENAKAVVTGSRYTPGTIHGAPVSVTVIQAINFAP